MTHLRRPLRLYIVAVVCAASVALALGSTEARAIPQDEAAAFAILLAMATVAQAWPVHLSTKVKITVDDTATFAAALALPPFMSMTCAAASAIVGIHFRNTNMSWYNRAFNAATSALSTGAAGMTYLLLAGPALPSFDHPTPIIAAAIAKYGLQSGLVDIVIALQLKRRPFDRWWELHRRDLAQEAALYLLGAIAAVATRSSPVALLLFGLPMFAMLAALRETSRVREQTRAAILELADLIDLRDPYTHGHSQRVAALAERLARRMKLEPTQVALIHDAARVHDIGKIGTNDLVLLKPGPLTPEERAEMQRHVTIGHQLLRHLPEFFEGAELVLAHHERHDGKGYPRGLKGDELPVEVSVISIADTYDAMSTDRPYRRGLGWETVRAELLANRGTQWRERVVDAFIEMTEEGRPLVTEAPARVVSTPA